MSNQTNYYQFEHEKIMGSGGMLAVGKFNLKELTPETMVLEFMNHQYVFRGP